MIWQTAAGELTSSPHAAAGSPQHETWKNHKPTLGRPRRPTCNFPRCRELEWNSAVFLAGANSRYENILCGPRQKWPLGLGSLLPSSPSPRPIINAGRERDRYLEFTKASPDFFFPLLLENVNQLIIIYPGGGGAQRGKEKHCEAGKIIELWPRSFIPRRRRRSCLSHSLNILSHSQSTT